MLIAAMNPCPCGFASDPVRECVCTPTAASRYLKRISGPLLDRIDLFAEVPRSSMRSSWARGLLQAAMRRMHLSARGYHRVLKVSRTIADLGGAEPIGVAHVAEALQYRPTEWA